MLLMRRYVAEFIGTFAIVFCGTGAIVIGQRTGAITNTGIAMTFGLVVMVMIHTLGKISGAHFNPAVSIAFCVAKRFPAAQLIPYMVGQLSGAMSASVLLHFLFPANALLGATLPAGPEAQSFVLEWILTFFLMLAILKVSSGSKEEGMMAGITTGAVVGLEALFAGPICGASMNPARSVGPAVISGHLEHLWLYVLAPAVGAVCAVPVWVYLSSSAAEPDNQELKTKG